MSINCHHGECRDRYECVIEDDLTWPLIQASEYYDKLLRLMAEDNFDDEGVLFDEC